MTSASKVDAPTIDAFLLVSFGGPEGPDDVMPFLENVTRGRNVPRERLLDVAEHYYQFGGVSPINQQCRDLLSSLAPAMKVRGIDLPIYWGNRNWNPLLADTLKQMAQDGIQHAAALVTSAYSGYSSCRQYREDIEKAQRAVGSSAPQVTKLRQYYDHPGFIEPLIQSTQAAVSELQSRVGENIRVVFTAHSIPSVMGENSKYQQQLMIASQLVAEGLDSPVDFDLVFQSRSGPPSQPWLGPDISDHLQELSEKGIAGVVAVPIGFVSDHLEVVYDLDIEASRRADELGIAWQRVPSVGTDPKFVSLICDLVEEQTIGATPLRMAAPIENFVACAADCCPSPALLAQAR